jgi:UDP-N-acetylglucosamine--N-acetylmuramyl-(pentapeptide) pyrophosphoryl-undecaprenol N-acetylglucosamine transferase
VIGYYVHHHGRGHLTRALAICAHLAEPVTFFSSLRRPAGIRAGDVWVHLPYDVPPASHRLDGVTANGRLHWAPLGVTGLADRAATLLEVLAATRPRRLVVDVSVEVTMLARLAGVPVTVMALPGERTDAAHRLAFDVADMIIACWTAELYCPPWLAEHSARTHFVGAVSRFEGGRPPRRSRGAPQEGLLLCGAGGSEVPADALEQLQDAAPQFGWRAAGGAAQWVDDLWPLLSAAEVVVTHAGQNALADVAAAGAPAVVIAEPRPFAEQRVMCEALGRAGVAVALDGWPDRSRWSELLAHAVSGGGRRWDALGARGAAARAAAVIAA